MKKTFMTAPIAMAAMFVLGATAQADVIWDGVPGDVVAATQSITRTDTFSTAGFESPTQGTDYYPAAANGGDENPNFYSANDFTANPNNTSAFTVFNGGVSDLLGRMQAVGGAVGTFGSMIAWDADAGTLDTFQSTGFGDFGNVTASSLQFIFQEADGDWFASSTSLTGDGSIADASAESWLEFTPHNGGSAVVGAAATPTSFDNVQLVGFYQEYTTTGGGGVFSTEFSATFSPVPEPSSLALLGLVGLAGVIRRKRA